MVRNRKRKTDIGSFTEVQMREALSLVEKGHSIRKSARMSGIKKTTLFSYLKKVKNRGGDQTIKLRPNYECRQVFTNEEESSFMEYIVNCSQMNFGLSRMEIRKLAYEMAKINEKVMPNSWHTSELAGSDWLYGFMSRHPSLSLRKPQACSLSRATSFNKHNVAGFFDKLEKVYSRCPAFANGTRVFNLDETATTTVQRPKNVVALKGSKSVAQVSSAERGALVTTCCIISSLGQSLPPVMVFPRKNFKENMIFGAPTGTLGLANPSGWMTSDLFLQVMKHFVKFVNSSKENPALLILDNHESHLSIPVLDYAKDNGVTMLTLHPHCSHKMQPLDVAVYGPFKSYYAGAMNAQLRRRPGVPLTIYNIAALVGEAFEKAMIPSNIVSGFRKTGIFPFNRDIFQEYEFSPSLVTDRPLDDIHETSSDSISNTVTDNPEQNPTDTTNRDQCDSPCTSSSISQPRKERPIQNNDRFISPEKYLGYPKAEKRKKKASNRRKGSSMIVTDTPQKNLLVSQRLHTKKTKPKKSQKPRKRLYSDSSDSNIEVDQAVMLCDDSSDNFMDEDIDIEQPSTLFPTTITEASVNDFVLVEFNTEPKKYYVGQVTKPKDDEDDLEVSYMRRKRSTWEFNFPAIKDIASVKLSDIRAILPPPNLCGTTSRQKSSYTFKYNFQWLNVN